MKKIRTGEKMRVIIAGSREFTDYEELKDKCDSTIQLVTEWYGVDEVEIISGTARGADKLGERFAKECNYKLTLMPADWKNVGNYAGFLRNQNMAKYCKEGGNPAVLIAFQVNDSKGTQNMIDNAKKCGIIVYTFQYYKEA
jgi:hypothetical protein